MRYQGFQVTARDATLGAFRPDEHALALLRPSKSLHLNSLARVNPRLAEKLVAGKIFIGADAMQPAIGDLRISYRIAPNGPVSLVGRQAGAGLAEY